MSTRMLFAYTALPCLLVYFIGRRIFRGNLSGKATIYPPGPPGKPLIGNLLDMPTKNFGPAAQKLGEYYGK